MIWVTGDKHGQLSAMELPDYKKIKKNDTLLICGDFGFIWDHSRAETKTLKALNKRKYTIAFVDGCHENFELLESYPIVEFHGGKARQIMPNIFQLMRGEVYEIEGKKILAFGGGSVENTTGDLDQNWENVEPTTAQIDNAVQHIKQVEGAVDIIISHEPPYSILGCMDINKADGTTIHDVLEQIRTHCKFKKWYFGKFHVDKEIPPYYTAVFDGLIPIQSK